MGFKSLGENVLISKRVTIDNPQNISIGSHVKIGSFVILGGVISIGNYVHIAAYTSLFAGDESNSIQIGDFIAISNYVRLITSSDDFSGLSMSAPFVGDKYRNNTNDAPIILEKHAIIGSGSLVLPGANLAQGAALGAMSMLKDPTEPFLIYAGIPAKAIKERSRKLLELEREFLNSL